MNWKAFLAAVSIFGLGGFLVYQYYASRYLIVRHDPTYASTYASELLTLALVAAFTALAFCTLFIYTALATRATARRMAFALSKDLALSREEFRRFYEMSPVPYLLITKGGKIKRPNKASLRLFGLDEEHLMGQDFFSFLSIPEQEGKKAMLKEMAARSVAIDQKEVLVTHANGAQRWALLSIEELLSGHAWMQEHVGLATLVDIHEQKELERIKTEFLSLASHQLRSPLANMKWYIDFLLEHRTASLVPETIEYLRRMYRRNEDMIDIVNTLLNLSRVEMGRIKVEKNATDLTALATSVLEELATAAQDKQITLTPSLQAEGTVETDAKLLRIVLQNLLTNAVRYTPNGGSVFITLTRSRREVRIEVRDTGIGIPPEEQGRIFSKLYRASNAKNMEANGNGIGLYMCKALVEGMQGTISFESVAGSGTTFVVTLPV